MRNIIFLLFITVFAVSHSVEAKTHTSKAKRAKSTSAKKLKSAKKAKLTKEAVFDGSVVHGKYQVAGGAVTAVENEKSLNGIVSGRRDFKDRLAQDLKGQP